MYNPHGKTLLFRTLWISKWNHRILTLFHLSSLLARNKKILLILSAINYLDCNYFIYVLSFLLRTFSSFGYLLCKLRHILLFSSSNKLWSIGKDLLLHLVSRLGASYVEYSIWSTKSVSD